MGVEVGAVGSEASINFLLSFSKKEKKTANGWMWN